MAVIQNGTPVNFGIVGLAVADVTSAGRLGTFIPQNFEHSKNRDKEQIRDGSGALTTEILYNPGEKATIVYFVKGTGLADAITQSVIPDIGDFVNISACTSYPALVHSTWRVVEDPVIKGTNTGAMEVTLKLEYHAGIAAIAGA